MSTFISELEPHGRYDILKTTNFYLLKPVLFEYSIIIIILLTSRIYFNNYF
jgi:putative effector of murein hydrolase